MLEMICDDCRRHPCTCPFVSRMTGLDQTPVYERGTLLLLRDSVAPCSDTPTGKTCPACAQENGAPGDGLIRVELSNGTTCMQCKVCEGNAWCPMNSSNLILWEAQQESCDKTSHSKG